MNDLQRLRRTAPLRDLFAETRVSPLDLVLPIFVSEAAVVAEPIASMPDQFRWPLSSLRVILDGAVSAGISAVLLFGIPTKKDETGSSSADPEGVIPRAISFIKAQYPEVVVITDVCLCAYTWHGHCGILRDDHLDSERSLAALAKQAQVHSLAGADIVAPSAMLDHQVRAVREAITPETAILAYSTKFASAYYGPFREAASSAPSHGDRAAYQHDGRNLRHARRELAADISEGADILMVKPGLPYLDIVRMAATETDLPIAVYNVSGEYAMVKAAAARGWIDERRVVLENLIAFRRAGAKLIITYHAIEAARWLTEHD